MTFLMSEEMVRSLEERRDAICDEMDGMTSRDGKVFFKLLGERSAITSVLNADRAAAARVSEAFISEAERSNP